MNPEQKATTTTSDRREAIAQTLAMRRNWRPVPRDHPPPAPKAKREGQEEEQERESGPR